MTLKIIQYVAQGKFIELENYLKPLEKSSFFDYMWGRAFLNIYLGNLSDAKEMAVKALSELNSDQNKWLVVKFKYILLRADQYEGLYEESKTIGKQILELIEAITDVDENEVHFFKFEAIRLIGGSYLFQGSFKLAEKHLNQAQNLDIRFVVRMGTGGNLNSLGLLYRFQWQFERSKKYFEQSIDFYKSYDALFFINFPLYNLASIYMERYEFENAEKYMNQIVELKTYLNNHMMISQVNLNYAIIYFHQQKLDLMSTHLEDAIKYAMQTKTVFWASRTILLAIKIALNHNQIEKANRYYDLFEEIKREDENLYLDTRKALAHGLILKNSKRLTDQAEAYKTFNEILNNKNTPKDIKVDSLRAQCEILFYELRASEDIKVIEDVEKIITKLGDLANESQIKALTIEYLGMKAHLAMIKGDIDQSDELLEICIQRAEEFGFFEMKKRYEELQAEVRLEFQSISDLVKQNSTMAEKLDLINVKSYIEYVSKMSIG